MAARYHVDKPQKKRVAKTALMLFDQVNSGWQFEMPLARQMLEWAARLHEIGLDISHDGYQRHGAHADLPGFPRAEQRFLAFLIGAQRHTINTRFQRILPRAWREMALRLALLLRLAVLLNRSRSGADLPRIRLEVGEKSLALDFDEPWLAANPLTVADLERESSYARAVGYDLSFS